MSPSSSIKRSHATDVVYCLVLKVQFYRQSLVLQDFCSRDIKVIRRILRQVVKVVDNLKSPVYWDQNTREMQRIKAHQQLIAIYDAQQLAVPKHVSQLVERAHEHSGFFNYEAEITALKVLE